MIHEGRVLFRGTPAEMESSDQQVVREFIARR
jgi:ABC-type transporter Mla maintaining outer membrane lipid asymmetry ATPase subunit MlaF